MQGPKVQNGRMCVKLKVKTKKKKITFTSKSCMNVVVIVTSLFTNLYWNGTCCLTPGDV